jgi:type I restriction enzyme R subunit
MSSIGQKERQSQNRIIKLLTQKMGYHYIGNLEDEESENIREDTLKQYLKSTGLYSETLIKKAIHKLQKEATITASGNLFEANKAVYSLLRYGVDVIEDISTHTQTVKLINWKKPQQNHFAVAEEVTVKGEHDKRPDIVLYINGIALGIIELKRSIVSISEGIRQNLDNQQHLFIKPFFTTIQLVMAGQDVEGLRYGTIETKEKYYLKWKEVSPELNPNDEYLLEITKPIRQQAEKTDYLLDKNCIELLNKERFLEVIHDFVVFDRGTKKLCRPNQYFGVKAAQQSIKNNEGGIIWHTQGSGKSLTMVWLTKWIREYNPNARVLILTDRDELDKQIEKVFSGVSETITRTKSGMDLIAKLNDTSPWLLCSLIHKFGKKDEPEDADYDKFFHQLKSNLPLDFEAKGDFYVFVDECHRTQSGKLHKALKSLLPNALFIGFTGTPLLKADKKKSIEVFGKYIHTYKFNEAVNDKVVLDLRYEARDIEQKITSSENIDKWFDAKTKALRDHAKAELKQKWGTKKKEFSSIGRLQKIVADIVLDMETKERLENGHGNAILIADGIYNACRYYELFLQAGFKECAIITSFEPSYATIKGEETGEGKTEKIKQFEVYKNMLNGRTSEEFEDWAKKVFVEEPARMKLLIVVNKLLTGFDAPSASYIYIDKNMRDHGLFQAICRVNRLDKEDKEYGFVVDYKDLFKSLEKAMTDYTSEAFDGYSKEDVEGLLGDRHKKGKERLDGDLEIVKALCENVPHPKQSKDYISYFCGNTQNPTDIKETEPKRIALYKSVISLNRAYTNIADDIIEAGYTVKEAEEVAKDVIYFENIRKEILLASGDYVDLKQYEPAMRHLIDSYIGAEESRKLSAFDDFSLIEIIVERGKDAVLEAIPENLRNDKNAVAEIIENNLRRVIIEETPTNPVYYEKMSVLLDELIKLRKQDAKNYEDYLNKIVEHTKRVKKPSEGGGYPAIINSDAKRALYDNLGKNEDLALELNDKILYVREDEWRGHLIKKRKIKKVIREVLGSYDIVEDAEIERILELIVKQREY